LREVVDAIRQVVDEPTEWPTHDLFPQYLSELP